MPRMKIFIESTAIYRAALRCHALSYQKKESPRVGIGQHGSIPCLRREIQGSEAVLCSIRSIGGFAGLPAQQRTDFFASAAIIAPLRVDGRIDEFIPVSDFNRSKLRACLYTCAAACALFMVDFEQNAISSK